MTQQLKRVPLPKIEFCDPIARVVPRGHRFEPVEDPHLVNRVACSDCGMEGWIHRGLVHAYQRDIQSCVN